MQRARLNAERKKLARYLASSGVTGSPERPECSGRYTVDECARYTGEVLESVLGQKRGLRDENNGSGLFLRHAVLSRVRHTAPLYFPRAPLYSVILCISYFGSFSQFQRSSAELRVRRPFDGTDIGAPSFPSDDHLPSLSTLLSTPGSRRFAHKFSIRFETLERPYCAHLGCVLRVNYLLGVSLGETRVS